MVDSAPRWGAILVSTSLMAGVLAHCSGSSPLLDPSLADRAAPAPDRFRVVVETTAGAFQVEAHRSWSPAGVDRLHYLARHGYYDGACFFRVVDGFVAQFGLAAAPRVSAAWADRGLPDEPVRRSNTRGRIAFARSGPQSRTTQLFINLADNPKLDTLAYNGVTGFPPIGEVVAGMDVVDQLHAGYGEAPRQDSIRATGNAYLERHFPRLDCITAMRIKRATAP